MTVNEGMLRKANIVTPQNNKVSIEVKTGTLIQKLNGTGRNEGLLSGTTVLNALNTSIMTRWKSKDLIADYGSTNDFKNKPDYTLTVSGEKNEDGSMTGAVLSGLTFMLIPATATVTYDLNFDFVNNHTNQHYSVTAKNAVTTWMQILLLPALPFSWIGSHNMLNDIADYTYDELQKQGAFNE
jgi:hypothetical protein